MGYNKRQFTKANDKKVLHKVRKHWVVVSMALLMAIGGKAAASHVSAHADTANNNANLTNRISNNISQSKSTLTSAKANSNNNANQAKANRANVSASANNVSKQANVLHQRILQNANLNSNQKSVQTPKINNVQVSAPKANNSQTNLKSVLNKNAQAAKTIKQPVTFGDDDDSAAKYTRTYYGVSKSDSGRMIYTDLGSESDEAKPGDSLTSMLNHWKNAVPEGYELDTTDPAADFDGNGTTNNGVILDGSSSNSNLSTFEGGEHTLDIYVKKIPPKASGTIAIQYENMSDNDAVLAGGKTYSNYSSDKMSKSDFNEDTHAVPNGFVFGSILNAGGLNFNFDGNGNAQNDVNYPSNTTQTVVVGVHPKETASNTETVNYLDQSDGNNVVDSRQVNGKNGSKINVRSDIDSFVPNGYDYVSNDFSVSGGRTSFVKNGTLNVEVRPNGIAPVTPKAPKGKGYITVNYVSDGGTNVLSKTVMDSIGTSFDTNTYTHGSNLPKGYSYNNDGNYNLDSDDANGNPVASGGVPVNNYSGKAQSVDIDVTKQQGYTPAKATAYIQYLNIKDGSEIGTPLTIDAGVQTHAGDPINYNQYVNFVPKDTTFAGMGSHDSGIVNGHTNYIYLKKADTSNVGAITVHYYDQHGYNVSNATINDANYGSNINVTDYHNKSNEEKKTLPNGYSVDPNENVTYRVDSDPQDVNVLIQGNHTTRTFNVVPIEHTPGQPNKKLAAKSVTISGNAGDTETVDPKNYQPSGYVPESNNNSSVIIAPNGKIAQQSGDNTPQIIGNNEIDFNYDQVAPVTVHYIDQNGNQVGNPEKIYSSDGHTVDVTKNAAQNASSIPDGYVPVKGQTTQYKVTTNPLNINFLVAGKTVNVNYTVHRDKYYMGSNTGETFNDVNVSVKGQVGNSIDVNPNDKKFEPAGYHQVGDGTPDKSYKITYNKATNSGSLDGNPFTFKYDSENPDVNNPKSINVVYKDQAGTTLSDHQLATGGYGDAVTVDDNANGGYLPNDIAPASAGNDFSQAYEVDQNQPNSMIATFGDQPQSIVVYVHGKKVSTNYSIQPVYNKDNKVTKGAVQNKTYSGEIGDHINVNPQDFNTKQADYEPTYQDAVAYLTVNSDGQAIPSSIVNGSNQVVNNSSNAQGALAENYNVKQSTINVQYKDVNAEDPRNGQIVNSDNILGNDTDNFNENKYTSGTGIPSGYVLDGTAPTINKFTSANQTLTIPVQQWDHTTIQYVNQETGDTVDQVNFSDTPNTMIPLSEQYVKNPPTGYDVTNAASIVDRPLSTANGGTITINVKPNGKHPNNKTDSKLGWITVNFVSSNSPHDGYTKSDITNSITFANDEGTPWTGGYTINGTQITNAVPSNTTFGGFDNDPETTATLANGFKAGQHQTMTVLYNGQPAPSANVTDYILYKDTTDGNTIGSDELQGMSGSKIDYSSYEKYVPQGYAYDPDHSSSNEATLQSHTKGNTPNVIWVTPEKSNITFGAVDLQYVADAGPENGHVISSDTEIGKTSDIFDPSKDEADVPSKDGVNYDYDGNDGAPITRYGTASMSHPDIMKVFVKPNTIKQFDNYTINYYTGSTKVASVVANGTYKNDFQISDYMDELPSSISGKYIATSSSLHGGGAAPTIFDGHDETIDIQLTSNND